MEKRLFTASAYINIIALIVIILAGCGKKEDFIAKIDDEYITAKDLDTRISKLPERYQDIVKLSKKKFLDELVIDELLYKEALKEKLDKDKEVKGVLEEAKKKILIAKLLKDNIDDKVTVDDVQVRDYYENHPGEFKTPEIFRASHIMVKTEDSAKNIALELANGAKFDDLARKYSIDFSAESGGDIGYFVIGQVDPDFERVAVNLKEGEISGVVKSKFGYHIIKLTERKLNSIEKYEDVKDRIRHHLITEKKKKVFNDLITRLKNNAKVVVKDELADESSKKETGNEPK
jgi:peptidyl-prolyl cis-trans isomerase C